MASFLNQFNNPNLGGFRHYSGLLPVQPMDGDSMARASVRIFHVPATNAAAIFRGDIVSFASSSIGVPGAADLPENISSPSTSVVIGNGGGSGLGNQSMAPNITRYIGGSGDTTSVFAGVVVGFGPITLFQAKNGFQFVPATEEAWVSVETDPQVEMAITVPTVPGTAFNLLLNDLADLQANAAFQSTRFGISGMSLNPAIASTSTFPLRVLSSGMQIGNDPTQAGFVANVMFNQTRHFRAGGGAGAD
jgi:hypothetical protein